jgi:hypothetical protein
VDGIGERLLDVYVFAGLHRRDGDGSVQVIRRRDDDRLDVLLLVQHLTEVAVLRGFTVRVAQLDSSRRDDALPIRPEPTGQLALDVARVDVADRDEVPPASTSSALFMPIRRIRRRKLRVDERIGLGAGSAEVMLAPSASLVLSAENRGGENLLAGGRVGGSWCRGRHWRRGDQLWHPIPHPRMSSQSAENPDKNIRGRHQTQFLQKSSSQRLTPNS